MGEQSTEGVKVAIRAENKAWAGNGLHYSDVGD